MRGIHATSPKTDRDVSYWKPIVSDIALLMQGTFADGAFVHTLRRGTMGIGDTRFSPLSQSLSSTQYAADKLRQDDLAQGRHNFGRRVIRLIFGGKYK